MIIREAIQSDLEGLVALYSDLRPQDLLPEYLDAALTLRRVLESGYTKLFVADTGDTLASTCMLAMLPNFAMGGRPIGVIEHVVTLAAFRGQGLAKETLGAALECAWANDCCKVSLLSGAKREEAHRLYESLGFSSDVERGFVL